MNEQIYKLAQEAGFSTWVLNPSKETMSDTPELLKKFAELIIRECAEQIKTHGISASREDYGDYEIGFNAGLFHALRTTKEHFGVKE